MPSVDCATEIRSEDRLRTTKLIPMPQKRRLVVIAGIALQVAGIARAAQPGVTFIGRAAIPGATAVSTDRSGLAHILLEDKTNYQDAFDGVGSAIAYTGFANRYILLPDRGPNKLEYSGSAKVDNTTSFKTRFHVVDIALDGSGDALTVSATLGHTSLLTNEAGQNFVGLLTTVSGADATQNLRFDPEGARVAPDGTVWISDEYGPGIYQFDQSGRRMGYLKLPKNFTVDQPGNEAFEKDPDHNTAGRFPNKGAEGLAITPDGRTLVAAMQGALIQDGGREGTRCRFLVYDLQHRDAPPRQLVYTLDSSKHGISEILAVNAHQFLVDERAGKGGPSSEAKLYLVDLNQEQAPTNVSAIASLAKPGPAENVVPLTKTRFADIGSLLDDAPGAYANDKGLPEKMEGCAFGPDLPDGRHLLLVTNDNDFSAEYPNYIFAFAVDPVALPEFEPVRLNTGVTFKPDSR